MNRKLIAVLGGALVTTSASASVTQLIDQDGAGQGVAHAGSAARAESAATIFFNPAGMAKLPGRNFSGGLTMVDASAKFVNGASTPAVFLAPPTYTAPGGFMPAGGDADGGVTGYVPNLSYTHQLNEQWTLGVGVNPTYGVKTNYPDDWRGRYLALKSDVASLNVSPSVAYKVSETLALGLGVDYQKFEAELTQAVNNMGLAATDGQIQQKGVARSWGWNAGLLFDVTPATRVGVAYRSKIDHKIKGSYTTSNVHPAILAGGGYASASGDGSAEVTFPSTWTISVAHALDNRWQVLADLSRTSWSDRSELRITYANNSRAQFNTFDWSDSNRIALGVVYRFTENIKWRAGVARDDSPVNDSNRIPRLPDSDRTWFALGMQYAINPASVVDIGYVHIKVADSGINDSGTPPNAAAFGTLNGRYQSQGDVYSIQYSIRF